MRPVTCVPRLLFAVVLAALTGQSPASTPRRPAQRAPEKAPPAPARIELERRYGSLPLAFEPNLGQADPRVRFMARGSGMTAYFTDTESVLVLARRERPGDPASPFQQAAVRMRLTGASPAQGAKGTDRLPGVSNYFLGSDPAQWRTGIPHYARLRFQGVYPGIDLVWYGNQRHLEYDFLVAPGADPAQIRIAHDGVESLRVDRSGDLVLTTRLGEIRQPRPRVYQEAGGRTVEIAARYRISAGRSVGFELARYDRTRELRIDPLVLVYSWYLGGSGEEVANAIAVDAAGSAYITGYTESADFPTKSGYQASYQGGTVDAFVTKLNPAGDALVYSSFIGGSRIDLGQSIAVDATGAAYLLGYTTSSNFPKKNPLQPALYSEIDLFVAKLNAAGNDLVYSTYLGGNNSDWPSAIAVDGQGAAYVTGTTEATDFPLVAPFRQTFAGGSEGFVAKVKADGSGLQYSTFLGGSGLDGVYAVAVDAAGAAYVAGATQSANFPVQSAYQAAYRGSQDGFVAKLAPTGSTLAYSTYLGGTGDDQIFGIAVDSAGAAYVGGMTNSADLPTLNALQASYQGGNWDGFVAKLPPAGNALVYSTYLGGTGTDWVGEIAVDEAGSAHVTGQTKSVNFPLQGAFQAAYGGDDDAYVAKLTPSGSALEAASFLGGTGEEAAYGIALGNAGAAYVAGKTESADFPVKSAYQNAYRGNGDVFVAKVQFDVVPAIGVTAVVSAASGAGGGLAPGEIASIYGAGLGLPAGLANSGWDPVTGKLPTALGGTAVTFDGQAAPLFYVSAGQVNVQVPYEVAGRASTSVVVTYNGAASTAINVPVVASHPGVFVYNNRAIITNNATGALITPAAPIARGGDIVVWATGPGVVAPAVTTGAPVATLSYAANPQAWIGGASVDVQFAGMTPGMAGLLQVNLRVPAGAPSGPDVPLRISIDGVDAQAWISGGLTSSLTVAIP